MDSYQEQGDAVVNGESDSTVSFENLHGNTIPTVEAKIEANDSVRKNPESDSESRNLADDNIAEGTEGDVERIAREIIEQAMGKATEQIKESSEQEQVSADLLNKREASYSAEQGGDAENVEDWLDILGNGLLKKKIITKGEGSDSRPQKQQEVIVNYKAKLADDTTVEKEENFVFILGDQDVVDVRGNLLYYQVVIDKLALDLSVNLMEKGEKSIIQADSKYAYGEDGKPPLIPPKSTLWYDIELKDVQDGPYKKTTDLEKRLSWADKKRQRGNEHYSKKNYINASHSYVNSIKILEQAWLSEDTNEIRSRINELRLKCYNNLAASQMKLENWKEALKASRAAEKLEPENVKALFRKGKILVMLGELDRGIQSLTKANTLEPENKIVISELAKHKKKLEQQKEAQKKLYRRMLGTHNLKKPSPNGLSSWMPSLSKTIGGTLALGVILLGVYIAQKLY